MDDPIIKRMRELAAALEEGKATVTSKYFCSGVDEYNRLKAAGIKEEYLQLVNPIPAESIPIRIGDISNYYGGLWIKDEAGKYYWTIEDWSRDDWKEIPSYLFHALLKFEAEREQ